MSQPISAVDLGRVKDDYDSTLGSGVQIWRESSEWFSGERERVKMKLLEQVHSLCLHPVTTSFLPGKHKHKLPTDNWCPVRTRRVNPCLLGEQTAQSEVKLLEQVHPLAFTRSPCHPDPVVVTLLQP
ncbi:hypothetical protein M0R45_028661 [Rubus argutus]|uniref:Uncharacterized protein n=1 Tax=Rubus argutus TaxID=59490 RepID=A0AAW1W9E5_RUBAR